MSNLTTFNTEFNNNVNSILNDQELFLSTFNKVISEVMPEDLKNEMLNASKEDKKALVMHAILSLGFRLTLNK
jgi:hypothetical protein